MPFTVRQSTGIIAGPDGRSLYTGYSGHGEGRCNPALQHVRSVGPIPQGTYAVGYERDVLRLKPVAAPQSPVYTPEQAEIAARLAAGGDPRPWMFGRDGAMFDGFITASFGVRVMIHASDDEEFEVLA